MIKMFEKTSFLVINKISDFPNLQNIKHIKYLQHKIREQNSSLLIGDLIIHADML